VHAQNRVFGAARAAEKTGCQRGLPGFFYQCPFFTLQTSFFFTFLLYKLQFFQEKNLGNRIADPFYLKEQPSIISGCCEEWLWTSQDGPEVVFLVLEIAGGCR
jgi:hypothetical protein